MSAVVHYWQFNRLNSKGQITVEEIAEAKSLIQKQCSDIADRIPLSDTAMQRHLFALLRQGEPIAQICLRCFISEQIEQVCINLERQFGDSHQFDRYDLFPFVLDDTLDRSKLTLAKEYQSMATKILQTFDPQQASLSTWTTRLVRYEQNLNQFLLERGLYLISDWAILNDTKPRQLQRILKEFHHLDDPTIARSCLLLEAYHTIYRQARLEQRKTGNRGKCPAPTPTQLQKIAQFSQLSVTPEKMLTQLQVLAEQLREYRIFVRGGKLKQDSLDHPDIQIKVEQQQVVNCPDDTAEGEFLSRYRRQFSKALERAIASVVPQWLNRQKEPKKQQFLTALKLFHCQGYSMTEIASAIGLQAQYQVTRLMQLKNFRSDIRQQMLKELGGQILEMAAIYTDPERLLQREQQIEIALAEQVASAIEQAEASLAKHQPSKSIFARSLCRYLHLRENSL
jgi:cytochrome c-type biogenesis protein CcmH/NrfF